MDTAGAWKPFQQCPTLFLLIINFPGGNTYNFFTPTKSSEQRLVAADSRRALAQSVSATLLLMTQHAQSTFHTLPPSPKPHFKNLPFKVFPNK